MKEIVKDIIIKNAWINLKDCSVISPDKISDEVIANFNRFFLWYRSHSFEFEYYVFEDVYKYWKNNVKDV